MFHLQKATQVTSDDELGQLAELYRYPPRPSSGPGAAAPFVRANMVASIDGAVTYDGKSGGLGGPGDRAVFRVLRGLADVILVGAGTATTEGYGRPQADEALAAHRESLGQAPAPALALVSRSLSIPPDFEPDLALPSPFERGRVRNTYTRNASCGTVRACSCSAIARTGFRSS